MKEVSFWLMKQENDILAGSVGQNLLLREVLMAQFPVVGSQCHKSDNLFSLNLVLRNL